MRRVGDRYAQLRLSSPAVAARGDRVVLRGETTLGGGAVLDPAPPRHASAERIELIERGDVAATIYAPVRLDALRHVLDGEPVGVERAGDWVFSRAWLDELRAASSTAGSTRPTRSTPASIAPAEPWAAAVVPLLGLERRGAKLYRPGAAASLGERAGGSRASSRRSSGSSR